MNTRALNLFPVDSGESDSAMAVALLQQFRERGAQEKADPAQLALIEGCLAKLSESERVSCVGLRPNSEGVLVRCWKDPAPPNTNPAPGAKRQVYPHTYCSQQCYVFTKARRNQGLGEGKTYVKGRHYSLKLCKGWIISEGVIVGWLVPFSVIAPCLEPYMPRSQGRHALCTQFKGYLQKRGLGPGDSYVRFAKRFFRKKYSPRLCPWWVVRDHKIAECGIEFTPKRASDKFCAEHSKASQNQELDLRRYPHLAVGVSILRTCAYRKCGKQFDRAKRSTSGEYYCPGTSHGALEKLARKEDRWMEKVEAAKAETAQRRHPADFDRKPKLWQVSWEKLWSRPWKVLNPKLREHQKKMCDGQCLSDKDNQRMRQWAEQPLGPGGKYKV